MWALDGVGCGVVDWGSGFPTSWSCMVRPKGLQGMREGTEGRHEAMDDLERQARAELVYRRAQRELGEAQVALKLLADLQKANPKDAVFEAAAGSAARVKGLLYKRVKDLEFAVFGRTA